jgi:hypothetical protein
MTTLASFQVTDLVDDNLAATHNRLLGGIFRAEFANTETISATKELADIDCQLQFITASGAAKTVELPPEGTDNHLHIIYNSGPTYDVAIKDDSGTYTFATLAPDEYAICFPLNAESWRVFKYLTEMQYKLAPTVAANNLTVTLTHLDGTAPSIYRPLAVTINGIRRYITAATSFTINAGTNYFNMGAVEMATLEQQLFVYAVWDSNSSIVAIAAARLPYGRLVSDFSATTTDQKHLFNYANFTTTDDVQVIGRFNVTLSGTAAFNWSVPTFTSSNLIHLPINETDWLVWLSTVTGFSGTPTQTCKYKLIGKALIIKAEISGTSNATTFTWTLPWKVIVATTNYFFMFRGLDNTVGVAAVANPANNSALVTNYASAAGAAWTASGTKMMPFGLIMEY